MYMLIKAVDGKISAVAKCRARCAAAKLLKNTFSSDLCDEVDGQHSKEENETVRRAAQLAKQEDEGETYLSICEDTAAITTGRNIDYMLVKTAETGYLTVSLRERSIMPLETYQNKEEAKVSMRAALAKEALSADSDGQEEYDWSKNFADYSAGIDEMSGYFYGEENFDVSIIDISSVADAD